MSLAGQDELWFVCVVGIDGAGKSESLRHLEEIRKDIEVITWKRHSHVLANTSQGVETAHDFILTAAPEVRVQSILDVMYRLLYSDVANARQNRRVPVIDSYWYKMVCKLSLLNLLSRDSMPVFRKLPAPASVVFFETPPEVAFSRKTFLTPFEAPNGPDSFVLFQRKLGAELRQEVADRTVLRVDASERHPGEIAESISAVLKNVRI